jgi:hypothetical protein
MKLLHTFALSALLLVPATAAQAIDVQVDVCVQARQHNKCAIEQDGSHNVARGRQIGEKNEMDIRQTGERNSAKARQTGPDNDIFLDQRRRRR